MDEPVKVTNMPILFVDELLRILWIILQFVQVNTTVGLHAGPEVRSLVVSELSIYPVG